MQQAHVGGAECAGSRRRVDFDALAGPFMTFVIRGRTPTVCNHCACLVEAVGIEPSSDHLVSHDSVAITRKGLRAETLLKPSESEFADQLGTRVPNFHGANGLLTHVRRVWGALRVV